MRHTTLQTPSERLVLAEAKRSRPSTRRKILYLAVVSLCTLATLEVGVRVMNRVRLGRWTVSDPQTAAANSRLYVGHPWLGQIPRPAAQVFSKGRHISINSFGYRGPEFDMAKPAGVVRVVCIGGSTTFDVKVSDDSRTWPARLEAILRDHYDLHQVQVINAATNGYALPRTIIDLALRTLDVQPDWVICYPGVNDLAYSDRPSHQYGRSHEAITRPGHDPPVWKLLCERLLPYSELYNEITSRIRYAKQVRWGNWDGVAIARHDELPAEAMAAFERNLTTLAGMCRSHGIRLALVTVRTAYGPDQPIETQQHLAKEDLMDHAHVSLIGHYAGYKTINRLIREAAERHGLLLIDQATALPTGEAHFADSVHFNDAGAAAFAEFAAERLASSQLGRMR
ncbi:MAG: SGNH/GDSL hydrolase family protein [Phycisphaerae bacterium]|nr:SGNH/GDSL hydrolase family protein [Phycisphaerae bacterium]